MSVAHRSLLVLLLVDSAVLAAVEVLFLPLRFDGSLLPYVGGLPFPVSALLAGLTVPWLVSSAAGLSDRLLVAAAPLLVWLGCVLLFALVGPGGDVVVLADWRTLLLLAAGLIPAATVLGRVQTGPAGTSPDERQGDRT